MFIESEQKQAQSMCTHTHTRTCRQKRPTFFSAF